MFKLKWPKWAKWLLIMLPLTIGMGPCKGLVSCETSTTPDPIDPPSQKYDLEMTYIRVDVSFPVLLPSNPGVELWSVSSKTAMSIRRVVAMERLNDYNFRCEFLDISANGSDGFYCLDLYDMARSDGVDGGSMRVGDRVIIKVRQTGFEAELKDIRPNRLSSNPYPTEKAKMACFVLTSDGRIVSNPQAVVY